MTAPIRLHLARHGRTRWNHELRFQGQTDIPLDEVGRSQAAALAGALRGRIDAVVTSDLSRASETARIIAAALELPVLGEDPELRERGYGAFEGLTREDCIAWHPQVWAARKGNPNFLPPGGEPHALVVARMHRALEGWAERLRGSFRDVLVVSHGSSLRMFLEVVTGEAQSSIGNLEIREVWHDGSGFRSPARVPAATHEAPAPAPLVPSDTGATGGSP